MSLSPSMRAIVTPFGLLQISFVILAKLIILRLIAIDMKFVLTRISRNRKLGPIPSVIASNDTCPVDCILRGRGCYAELGPLSLQWKKANDNGMSFETLLREIRKLPRRQIWRYGTAGDLPPDRESLLRLAAANQNRPVLVYTHRRDFEAYHIATASGFHVNLSADDVHDADRLAETGLSVTVTLPSDKARRPSEPLSIYRKRLGGTLKSFTPKGRMVIPCPASYTDITCLDCQLCAQPRKGGVIVGFPAHGSRKTQIDERLSYGLSKSEIDSRFSGTFEPRIAA